MTIVNGQQRRMLSYGIFCLMILGLISVANATLVESPNNGIVLERESPKTIDMACKSNSQYKLSWFVQKNHDSEKLHLFNGYFLNPNAKSYCTVLMDEPGKYNLRLRNTAEAAQTYICVEPGTLTEASADLIWLSDLTCNDSSTENLLNLTCSIEFRGNWAPTMEWKEHSNDGEKVLSFGVNKATVPNQRFTSTLVLAVQKSSRNYTCTLKFDISGKPSHTTATNIPDYNQIWKFAVLPKSQDEPIPTLAVAATIVAPAVIAAAIILVVLLFILKRHMRVVKMRKRQRKMEKVESHNLP